MPMTIEKAQVTLPSDREVKVTRSFKAPGRSSTGPTRNQQLVQRWLLGPPGWTMPVCEMDVRVGGRYRWRWRSNKDASEFGFHGAFTRSRRAFEARAHRDLRPGDRRRRHAA